MVRRDRELDQDKFEEIFDLQESKLIELQRTVRKI